VRSVPSIIQFKRTIYYFKIGEFGNLLGSYQLFKLDLKTLLETRMDEYNLKEVTEFRHHLMFNQVFGENHQDLEDIEDERRFLNS
jgi:hypothetical protein